MGSPSGWQPDLTITPETLAFGWFREQMLVPDEHARRFLVTTKRPKQASMHLIAVEMLHAFAVHESAFSPPQHMEPSIAEPPSLLGQGLQPLAQRIIVGAQGSISHGGTIGPAAHSSGRPKRLGSLAAVVGRADRCPMRPGRWTPGSKTAPAAGFSSDVASGENGIWGPIG